MARRHRWFIPGISAHVIKRGNNRSPIFSGPDDYLCFLDLLRTAATAHAVAVHAFVLMTNHVHLLVTPGDQAAIPAMMKALGERYSRYFNRAYLRTGTPWDGRYRAFLIQDERYWLTCLRYIELNPVRAQMVLRAQDYEWSSYRAHALQARIEWLEQHPLYRSLGASGLERATAYRRLCAEALPDDEVRRLRSAPASHVAGGRKRGQTPGSDPAGDAAGGVEAGGVG